MYFWGWGGDSEDTYSLWLCTIVMLMWSDTQNPQSGIILYDSAEYTFLQERWGQNVRITEVQLKINVGELLVMS